MYVNLPALDKSINSYCYLTSVVITCMWTHQHWPNTPTLLVNWLQCCWNVCELTSTGRYIKSSCQVTVMLIKCIWTHQYWMTLHLQSCNYTAASVPQATHTDDTATGLHPPQTLLLVLKVLPSESWGMPQTSAVGPWCLAGFHSLLYLLLLTINTA